LLIPNQVVLVSQFSKYLFLALPVLAVIGLIIRFDSKGPAVFAHNRVGRNGKLFPCYKFRTMVPDAEAVLERYLSENPKAR
jgi:lipopolysaccharide/colanic/teichoic acid biosynthesis glycosyltransferase